MSKISIEDDSKFEVADGMELGSLDNGNLRLIVSVKGKDVAIELPNAWLHTELGLKAFITENCHPKKGG